MKVSDRTTQWLKLMQTENIY